MRGAPARALLACRRLRPRSDYEVNLGAEMESRALHDELDALRETQWGAPVQPRHEQIALLQHLLAPHEPAAPDPGAGARPARLAARVPRIHSSMPNLPIASPTAAAHPIQIVT